MATLSASFSLNSASQAVVIPAHSGNPALSINYKQLSELTSKFQQQLAALGVTPHSAVSISLPNSLEFIITFLAATWQRAIAAPLNPGYKQEENEFYIDDLKSALVVVPRGAVKSDAAIVRAARKYNAAVAEVWWDPSTEALVLDVKELGNLKGKGNVKIETAQPDDVALVLHTSGTTGRPKAVPLTQKNLTTTMRKPHHLIVLTDYRSVKS
jgi:oxalate---CoA ligase